MKLPIYREVSQQQFDLMPARTPEGGRYKQMLFEHPGGVTLTSADIVGGFSWNCF